MDKPSHPSTTQHSCPREAAFLILQTYQLAEQGHRNKSNSMINDALDEMLSGPFSGSGSASHSPVWSSQDRGLFTTLVYGVLRQWFFLETLISQLSHFSIQKMSPPVLVLMKLGLYQLHFMDGVPDYAAVNATIDLAKTLTQKSKELKATLSPKTLSFMNAMMRTYQRKKEEKAALGQGFPVLPSDELGFFSMSYSWPSWMTQKMMAQYPPDAMEAMAMVSKTPAPLSLRINTLKTTVSNYLEILTSEGIRWTQPFPEELPEALILMDENGPTFQGSPVNLPGFQEGCVTVQDVGASWVSAWLNPQPGDFIIDLCAAPGGKTAHLAALMQNKGTILAVDSVAKRMDRFHQNMTRLGVTIAEALVHDVVSWQVPENYPPFADGILLDAPCSGLGTIRRHPEILVQANIKKLEHFPNQQLQLLKKASSFLKPEGVLVYSTCSVDKDENQGVIQTFLKKAPHFQLEKDQQLLISKEHEGFYMAKLKRIS